MDVCLLFVHFLRTEMAQNLSIISQINCTHSRTAYWEQRKKCYLLFSRDCDDTGPFHFFSSPNFFPNFVSTCSFKLSSHGVVTANKPTAFVLFSWICRFFLQQFFYFVFFVHLCVSMHILLLTFFFFNWAWATRNKTKPITKCEAYCEYSDLILFVCDADGVSKIFSFRCCSCFAAGNVRREAKASAISRLLFHPWHMHRIFCYNTITLTVVLPKWLWKILHYY